jgi:hypothetical protein
MPTIRMISPDSGSSPIMANGRSYVATPGLAIDVPDADAQVLGASGFARVAFSGPTTGRPHTSQANGSYFTAAQGS